MFQKNVVNVLNYHASSYIKNKLYFLIIIFLFIFINTYGSIVIFNSLYEINISLVGIINQILYLIYQINLDLISIFNDFFN